MQLSESVTVHAPAHEVFERLRDLEHATERISGIEGVEVLAGPARIEVGTRWRETRRMFGQEATEEMEVVELVPDSHYTTEAVHEGIRYLSGFRVAPVATGWGEATRVTMDFSAEALTRRACLASLLMRPMARMVAAQCRADLLDVKASFEH
ncbi:SRPBCC family protein [Kytococcus sp. Marseille-QA3725]